MRAWKWDGETIEETERLVISQAFDACDGNIRKTARLLGSSRAFLYKKLKAYELFPRKPRVRPKPMKRTVVREGSKNDIRSE